MPGCTTPHPSTATEPYMPCQHKPPAGFPCHAPPVVAASADAVSASTNGTHMYYIYIYIHIRIPVQEHYTGICTSPATRVRLSYMYRTSLCVSTLYTYIFTPIVDRGCKRSPPHCMLHEDAHIQSMREWESETGVHTASVGCIAPHPHPTPGHHGHGLGGTLPGVMVLDVSWQQAAVTVEVVEQCIYHVYIHIRVLQVYAIVLQCISYIPQGPSGTATTSPHRIITMSSLNLRVMPWCGRTGMAVAVKM